MSQKTNRVEFNLNGDENDTFNYSAIHRGARMFVWAIPFGIGGYLTYFLLNDWAKDHPAALLGVNQALIGISVLPLAILINSLHSESRGRNQKAHGAMEALKGANTAVVSLINTCENAVEWARCFTTYKWLLRSVFYLTTKQPFEVVLPDGKRFEEGDYDHIHQVLDMHLTSAKLVTGITWSNGRLHQLTAAKNALQSLVNNPIRFSNYVATAVLFLLSYIPLTLWLITDKQTEAWAPYFCGAFSYGIWLAVLVASSSATAFAGWRPEIKLDQEFKIIERRNEEMSQIIQTGKGAGT